MIEPFVDTETDRTKSGWISRVYMEFGRMTTTVMALHYYALSRNESDYPICGGFVGEIRVHRRYSESDRSRISKWVLRAKQLGFIPWDGVLSEEAETVIDPAGPAEYPINLISDLAATKSAKQRSRRLEIWCSRPVLIPILAPVARKCGAALVAFPGLPSWSVVWHLSRRAADATDILCLSDLDKESFQIARDLAVKIINLGSSFRGLDIRIRRIGLTPSQVLDLDLPVTVAKKGEKDSSELYKIYTRGHGLDPKKGAELDALEVYHAGGVAGFLEEAIRFYDSAPEQKWLINTIEGTQPGDKDVDYSDR